MVDLVRKLVQDVHQDLQDLGIWCQGIIPRTDDIEAEDRARLHMVWAEWEASPGTHFVMVIYPTIID